MSGTTGALVPARDALLGGRTGDIDGNLDKVKRELRRIRFPVDFDGGAAREGDPMALLPALHYALLGFSRHVTNSLGEAGHDLQAKSDARFVEGAWRALREEFGYNPALTPQRFLSPGFAERKLMLLHDTIELCKRRHNEHARAQRRKDAARDVSRREGGVPRVAARAAEEEAPASAASPRRAAPSVEKESRDALATAPGPPHASDDFEFRPSPSPPRRERSSSSASPRLLLAPSSPPSSPPRPFSDAGSSGGRVGGGGAVVPPSPPRSPERSGGGFGGGAGGAYTNGGAHAAGEDRPTAESPAHLSPAHSPSRRRRGSGEEGRRSASRDGSSVVRSAVIGSRESGSGSRVTDPPPDLASLERAFSAALETCERRAAEAESRAASAVDVARFAERSANDARDAAERAEERCAETSRLLAATNAALAEQAARALTLEARVRMLEELGRERGEGGGVAAEDRGRRGGGEVEVEAAAPPSARDGATTNGGDRLGALPATPAAFARGGGGAFSAVFNHPSGDPSEPLGVSARPARAPAPAETGAFIDYYSSLLGVDKAALTPNRANEE